MDARIAGQLSGVGHSIPTRNEQALEPRAQSAVKRGAGGDTDAPAQVFDANGDGAIEHWSYAHGGDSYKTFKPPPSGKAGANLRRVSHAPSPAPAAHGTRPTNAHTATAAAMHHAHEAYQRDGGAPTTDARAAAPATAARASDASRAANTQPATPAPPATPAAAASSMRP